MSATPEQIDDAVDRWHDGRGYARSRGIAEYLGWTDEEYKEWVRTDIGPDKPDLCDAGSNYHATPHRRCAQL